MASTLLAARQVACSGSTLISQCDTTDNYNLPTAGNTTADWVIAGIYTAFYASTCWGTWRAFQRRKTLRLPWISLLSFTVFRAIGYFMKAWTDSNPIQDDWTYDQAASWVKILTASYSIISAGTTFFLVFCGSLAVAHRRCCAVTAGVPAYKEDRIRKPEDRAFMAFRLFVVAVAALNIVGALRQFDYYWLNYDQGIVLRKAGGYIQILVTVGLIVIVAASQTMYSAPRITLRGFFLLESVLLLYLVVEIFNLVRVYEPLTSPVNADPVYQICLQAVPDFINLFHLLIFNFDNMLDYETISDLPSREDQPRKSSHSFF